jgi:hypothetical protein
MKSLISFLLVISFGFNISNILEEPKKEIKKVVLTCPVEFIEASDEMDVLTQDLYIYTTGVYSIDQWKYNATSKTFLFIDSYPE